MAKEQLAVIEMITNMILGKTDGVSKVDFTPQKIPFRKTLRMNRLSCALHRRARVSLPRN